MKHVHRERKNKVRRSSSNGHHSSGVLIKEQSQSVLRGEHPIAFVLPTVSSSRFSYLFMWINHGIIVWILIVVMQSNPIIQ